MIARGVFQKNVYKFHFPLAGITFFAKNNLSCGLLYAILFYMMSGSKPRL